MLHYIEKYELRRAKSMATGVSLFSRCITNNQTTENQMRTLREFSPLDVSKRAGTSLSHIENTYLKYSEEMAVSAALKNFSVSANGLIVRD